MPEPLTPEPDPLDSNSEPSSCRSHSCRNRSCPSRWCRNRWSPSRWRRDDRHHRLRRPRSPTCLSGRRRRARRNRRPDRSSRSGHRRHRRRCRSAPSRTHPNHLRRRGPRPRWSTCFALSRPRPSRRRGPRPPDRRRGRPPGARGKTALRRRRPKSHSRPPCAGLIRAGDEHARGHDDRPGLDGGRGDPGGAGAGGQLGDALGRRSARLGPIAATQEASGSGVSTVAAARSVVRARRTSWRTAPSLTPSSRATSRAAVARRRAKQRVALAVGQRRDAGQRLAHHPRRSSASSGAGPTAERLGQLRGVVARLAQRVERRVVGDAVQPRPQVAHLGARAQRRPRRRNAAAGRPRRAPRAGPAQVALQRPAVALDDRLERPIVAVGGQREEAARRSGCAAAWMDSSGVMTVRPGTVAPLRHAGSRSTPSLGRLAHDAAAARACARTRPACSSARRRGRPSRPRPTATRLVDALEPRHAVEAARETSTTTYSGPRSRCGAAPRASSTRAPPSSARSTAASGRSRARRSGGARAVERLGHRHEAF